MPISDELDSLWKVKATHKTFKLFYFPEWRFNQIYNICGILSSGNSLHACCASVAKLGLQELFIECFKRCNGRCLLFTVPLLY